jgi:hypothetical protein
MRRRSRGLNMTHAVPPSGVERLAEANAWIPDNVKASTKNS